MENNVRLSDLVVESRKKEKKIFFIETDGYEEFPKDTMTSLEKEINKNCKDLELEWQSAIEVVNTSFNNLDVPIPRANQKDRWEQYKKLLRYAVKNLSDARGFSGWTTTV